jgi:hypothetical protein
MPRTSRDRKRRNRETKLAMVNQRTDNSDAVRAARDFAQLLERLEPFTVMLRITTTDNPSAADVIANATGSLVFTGEKELLITNHHVYKAFQSYRDVSPSAKLIMSGSHGKLFLDISNVVCLGLDEELDLAVLYVPKRHVFRQGKLFLSPDRWPPDRPEVGMLAVLYGYPGEGRQVEQSGALGASPLSAALRVVSVSDRHFVLADEDQDAHVFVPDGQKPLTSFGGISGSAVHVVRPPVAAFDDVWLCGFVYEEGLGHSLMVAHADHINADGTIR